MPQDIQQDYHVRPKISANPSHSEEQLAMLPIEYLGLER
jgi:hypothetical protein